MRTIIIAVCVFMAVLAFSVPASAAVINFDDAYASLGQAGDPNLFYSDPIFGGSYYGLIGGIGNGDPGNWSLEGTNGSAALGTNGGYDGSLHFSSSLNSISLDVSRANGSSAGQTFSIEFYLGELQVGSDLVTLGDINTWTTITFNTYVFDEVRWQGSANGFSPFGIDNIVYSDGTVETEASNWNSVKSLYR